MSEQRSIPIETRLSAAFGAAGVPPHIKRFFQWEPLRPGRPGPSREAAREVSREINAIADAARRRLREARERLDLLESSRRSSRTAVEVAEARRALQTRLADITADCETEAPASSVSEGELRAAQRSVAEAEDAAENWEVLSALSDVIAGLTKPSARLAERLRCEVWELCHPNERRLRAKTDADSGARPRQAEAGRADDVAAFTARVATIEARLLARRRA